MQLVDFSDVPDLKFKYPLFFQENFAAYEKTKGYLVKIVTDGKSFMPFKTKTARFVTQAQYLYPPVKNGARLSPKEEECFLQQFVLFCKQKKLCDFIIPPLHYSLFNSVPVNSYFSELGIIAIDLERSEEQIFKSFSNNYRNEIRKAIAEKVIVEFDQSYFASFYKLYKSTHQKQGIYFDSETELKNMVDCLGERSCFIAVAKNENGIYGAALILFNANEAYYFQSGAVDNCPYPGANKLLQLEIMRHLKNLGIKRYIMGGYRLGEIAGTKYEGIQKFKMRFGAEIEQGFHFYTKISWRYSIYKTLLNFYLQLRGIKQNVIGLNFRYN